MKRTFWHNDATPVENTLDKVIFDIKFNDIEGLLLDSVSLADIIEDSDGLMAFDALVTPYARLPARMDVLLKVMKRSGTTVQPLTVQCSEPFMQNGTANVAAIFELSDGQTISIFFHNPDTTPKKILPTDELISWKWLLNKKDITIVVAPEKGLDLNPRQVAVRIMKLAEKNSVSFVRSNGKRAERMQALEDLKTEITGLEGDLKGALHRLEIAKVEKEDRDMAVAEPVAEQSEPIPDQEEAIHILIRLGWKYNNDYTELRHKEDDNLFILTSMLEDPDRVIINQWNTGESGGYVEVANIHKDEKTNEQFANEINEAADALTHQETNEQTNEQTEVETETEAAGTEGLEIGAFGPILKEFYHNAQGAIAKLTELQTGEAVAALSHPDVGDIDLVWGKEGTGASDGFGLSKLIKFHPEVINDLQGIISSLSKVNETSTDKRIQLESKDHKAAVRLEWDGMQKTWLLTAFEKYKDGDSTRADTADISEEDDTAGFLSIPNKNIPQPENNAITSVEIEKEIEDLKPLIGTRAFDDKIDPLIEKIFAAGLMPDYEPQLVELDRLHGNAKVAKHRGI